MFCVLVKCGSGWSDHNKTTLCLMFISVVISHDYFTYFIVHIVNLSVHSRSRLACEQ